MLYLAETDLGNSSTPPFRGCMQLSPAAQRHGTTQGHNNDLLGAQMCKYNIRITVVILKSVVYM